MSFLTFSSGAPAATFELSLEIELGQDRGQGLGTLFETRDKQGRLLFGAGFQDAFSTYIRDNNRMLSFFYKGSGEDIYVERLGKPFDSQRNGTRLMADRGALAVIHRYGNPIQIQRVVGAGQFIPYAELESAEGARLAGLQYIGDRRLIINADSLVLDGKTIYAPGESFQFYYANGTAALFHNDPQRIYIGPWNPEESTKLDRGAFQEFPVAGYPFVYGVYRDEIILVTNIGNFYSYKNGALNVVRASDGASWQAYSVINVNGELLIGQYPTGSLFTYNDRGLREFEPRLPVPENTFQGSRELQTLALYAGDLYAGVWPWGELWRLDLDTQQWHFVKRLFDTPEVSLEVDAPYAKEMKATEDVYNYWGQRITSLVPHGDSLYIATMNKQGLPHVPERHGFVTPDAVEQYGRLHRLRAPAQVTAQIEWRSKSTFRFVCDNGRLAMFQDGELLAETTIDPAAPGERKIGGTIYGRGIFGDFGGASIKLTAVSSHNE